MKKLVYLLSIVYLVILSSCEIVQETKFNEDGSGTYSLGFDMSEMLKMGPGMKKDSTNNEQIDTVIHFSEYLKEKKDSIAKLSIEDQEKIKQLEAFSFYMKSDTVSKQLIMKLDYDFKDIKDLKKFGEKLQHQKVKELDLFTKQLNNNKNKEDGIQDFNTAFNTSFSRTKFSATITEEAFHKAVAKKDTTMTKDSPMSDMIRFKIRYVFPYKIKKVSNKNARILSDFKGVEIDANLFETNNNPNYFNIEVEFENE